MNNLNRYVKTELDKYLTWGASIVRSGCETKYVFTLCEIYEPGKNYEWLWIQKLIKKLNDYSENKGTREDIDKMGEHEQYFKYFAIRKFLKDIFRIELLDG